MQSEDTIFALATPPGRSGVAVLRISGARAHDAVKALGAALPAPRVATLTALCHPATQEVIDRALLLWFPAPASFTGEDVAELHIHGSRAVISETLEALSALPGLRLAEPGEFSRRAFLNGKMDLTETEGLADLIDAETSAQRRQALHALGGAMGVQYEALRADALRSLARLEAWIDFPDEDIPPETWAAALADVEDLRTRLTHILAEGKRGELVRDGLSIVILGAPNAGKSSLLNALARREAAIVSQVAGTTRDVIEVRLELAGAAAVLVDTAGLRDSADPIEQEGIRRARARAEAADIKLVCFDGSALPGLDAESLALLDAQALAVLTKADCLNGAIPERVATYHPLAMSALTGDGLAELEAALAERVAALTQSDHHPLITRARHRAALEAAVAHLSRFSPDEPVELACEELRQAALHIGKITGKIVTDEVLGQIFREFCIGK